MSTWWRISLLNTLLTFACWDVEGLPDVLGSFHPVKALVGQDVILPCHVSPSLDVSSLTVEWKLNKTLVHVFRNRRDDVKLPHKDFKGRTSLFHDEMTHGNLSLKLSAVNKLDAGNYSCFVPKLNSQVRRGYTVLIVEDADKAPKKDVHPTPKDKGVGTKNASHKEAIPVGLVFFIGIVITTIFI